MIFIPKWMYSPGDHVTYVAGSLMRSDRYYGQLYVISGKHEMLTIGPVLFHITELLYLRYSPAHVYQSIILLRKI